LPREGRNPPLLCINAMLVDAGDVLLLPYFRGLLVYACCSSFLRLDDHKGVARPLFFFLLLMSKKGDPSLFCRKFARGDSPELISRACPFFCARETVPCSWMIPRSCRFSTVPLHPPKRSKSFSPFGRFPLRSGKDSLCTVTPPNTRVVFAFP